METKITENYCECKVPLFSRTGIKHPDAETRWDTDWTCQHCGRHKKPEKTKYQNFYFTFGYGHEDSNGRSLSDCYTIVKAENYNQAREKMIKIWGNVWAFQYITEDWANNGFRDTLIYVPFPPSQIGDL